MYVNHKNEILVFSFWFFFFLIVAKGYGIVFRTQPLFQLNNKQYDAPYITINLNDRHRNTFCERPYFYGNNFVIIHT